jgi:branched-chain amino acid transport system substrate-binding protein
LFTDTGKIVSWEGNRVRTQRLMTTIAFAIAVALTVGGCGGSDGGGGGGSKSVTIYSSLPLQGDSRAQSEAMVNGMTMALQEANNRAGAFKIKYVSLDDSTASAGKWDPGQVSANARKVAQDDSAVAYLGESNSGATAVSLPLLNDAGLLQISPSNTYVGLTRSEGADKGEPEKYYPSGKRTYGRIMPPDNIDAAAQVSYQKAQGCSKLYVLNDKEVYGKGVANLVAASAPKAGIKVLGNEGLDMKAANFRAIAAKIKASGADCMFYGAATASKAVQVWIDVNGAAPDLKLFGPAGMSDSTFTGEIPAAAQRQTFLTTPTLDPELYPPSGQAFFKSYQAKYGQLPESYGIYGYEAMKTALLAIQQAGDQGNDRQAVVDAFFKIKDRDSVLGNYSIDGNGDTTLSSYGGNRVKGGKLVFDKVIKVQGAA